MNLKTLRAIALSALCATVFSAKAQTKTGHSFVAESNVSWQTRGNNENDSMPIGNGDLAANVWTEQNGDIVLLLAKADSWTETGAIVKLGRVRIKMSPNPFTDDNGFKQVLRLDNGSVEIEKGGNSIQIWADANNPVIHVEAHTQQAIAVTANVEFWRKTQSPGDVVDHKADGFNTPRLNADVVFAAQKDQVTWCHFNNDSYYPYLLRQEHLEPLIGKYTDPLYHRCFGVAVTGNGFVSKNDHTLQIASAGRNVQLDIVALTKLQAASAQDWKAAMDAGVRSVKALDIAKAKQAHEKWWADFWDRSWMHVSGNADAAKVNQGYAIQRYMVACSSRGEMPVKFNGGLFTVGHDIADTVRQRKEVHDPDYRAWGESYWNQNNRLMYWPLIATGDTDLLQPWFNMYTKMLDFQKDRNQLYYHQPGASYPETMQFWGLPRLGDFGKDNPTNEIQSHWQRYHVQGTLEVIAQMLDVYDNSPDDAFAKKSIVPFADAIVTYYGTHWQRDAKGKINMSPTQSLETYQLDAVNPTPDIAGLMSVIPRLLALPKNLTTEQQRAAWAKTLNDLPPIPLGTTTAKGKIPPLGVGEAGGLPTILPAEKYGKPGNSENPELYVAFPYRLFGVGKPNLDLVKNAFAARRSPQNTCWGQDGTQAAVIGLTDVAQKAAIAEFSNYGEQRFLWFWKSAHDWIPDLDNGGDGMITLQNMMMQCDGKRIQLTPAWPADWDADFKLHAPGATTVEGHVHNGKISDLKVTPASRAKDVVIVKS